MKNSNPIRRYKLPKPSPGLACICLTAAVIIITLFLCPALVLAVLFPKVAGGVALAVAPAVRVRRERRQHNSGEPRMVGGRQNLTVIPNMTEQEVTQRLLMFASRAKRLVGTGIGEDGQQCALNDQLATFFTNIATKINDPKAMRERAEFMEKMKTDPDARKQFNALRLTTYNNYLIAEMRWSQYFYKIINLLPEERPMVQNHYDKEIKCYYVGQDGKPKEMKIFFDDTEALLPLRTLTTPIMRFKEQDIYRGNVVDQAVKSLTMARDLANKIEYESKLVLISILGAFTFTGPKANWSFVANSYIDTRNLPTTNDVPVKYCHGGGVPGSVIGAFDYSTLDEIINYAKLVNGVRPSGMGEFKPTGRIRVPSTHIRNFGTFAAGSDVFGSATPAAAAPSNMQETIYEDGWGGVHYKGIDWIFEPDATLDPTVNQCYPEFTIKAGEIFFKPSMDRERIRTGQDDDNLFQENAQTRQMKKVYSAYVNSAMRIFFARFNY